MWALPEVVKEAAKTYRDAEKIIKAGEELLKTPYDWENYDILVVPKYMYGGMENPQLTFITQSSMIYDQMSRTMIQNCSLMVW